LEFDDAVCLFPITIGKSVSVSDGVDGDRRETLVADH
jgi:hypothetical protein